MIRKQVTEIEPFAGRAAAAPVTDDGPLAREVAAANAAAVAHSRTRLSARLPGDALAAADRYFERPSVAGWPPQARPALAADELFRLVCATPRSATVRDKADGLQIELRSLDETFELEDLGHRVEPDSDVLMLSSMRLAAAAARNTSIELRQFDRQCPSWAPFADDLAAVTGADVYLKLFIADGNRSVNGWHRDSSDVLVTMLHGEKRFATADAEAGEPDTDPEPEVDALLRPGDALRLPRSMLHCATPSGGLSALLSMGLMRVADWPYRQIPPIHLGFRDYPRSAAAYRLCLRPHTPAATAKGEGRPLRSRAPGGIALLDTRGEQARVVTAGTVYEASTAEVRVLATVHGGNGLAEAEVAARTGLPVAQCAGAMEALVRQGLLHYS
ncbi:MAG: JmjC domain-containing protein [Streptomycetales bacterium]